MVFLSNRRTLTEEDDDTEEDGYDGPRAQTGSHDLLLVGAVSVDVTLAHFDLQVRGAGHGQVARVSDYDWNLINATFKETDSEAELSVVT